ncbi:hypothetical protein B0T24DRAFT_643801 [Lasiosphaeria ovina]|uniref:Uncharacterized protein n=1 Tax=Lasiosphaeria ovina TaxID=92902 RepID=A0AAE0JSD3_9PEZI|nr:hypothetical protein B0T24DRAFT_643801 [Lasiosphaeria ovina]
MSGDIAEMWQRHLVAAGDDASATSVRVMPSANHSLDGDETGASIRRATQDGTQWDEKMNSVVDTLQDMIAQSPNTPDTHSPEAPWFTDREGYTETALSSPQNSSWSRTIAPPKKQRPASSSFRGVDDGPTHSTKTDFNSGSARDCRTEKGKGKGLGAGFSDVTKSNNTYTLDPEPFSDWYRDHATSLSRTTQQKLILTSQNKGYYTMPAAPETATAIYSDRRRGGAEQKAAPPPDEVHVLVLTWAKHDRRGDDGQLLSPGLDTDTDTVRACFKRRGYRVQCRLIPDDYPTAAVETMLDRFLSSSSPSTLLVIYYHGFGSMERDRMVFSR